MTVQRLGGIPRVFQKKSPPPLEGGLFESND